VGCGHSAFASRAGLPMGMADLHHQGLKRLACTVATWCCALTRKSRSSILLSCINAGTTQQVHVRKLLPGQAVQSKWRPIASGAMWYSTPCVHPLPASGLRACVHAMCACQTRHSASSEGCHIRHAVAATCTAQSRNLNHLAMQQVRP
jgi:hypothetical protein